MLLGIFEGKMSLITNGIRGLCHVALLPALPRRSRYAHQQQMFLNTLVQ
jgi:hypothetical protein